MIMYVVVNLNENPPLFNMEEVEQEVATRLLENPTVSLTVAKVIATAKQKIVIEKHRESRKKNTNAASPTVKVTPSNPSVKVVPSVPEMLAAERRGVKATKTPVQRCEYCNKMGITGVVVPDGNTVKTVYLCEDHGDKEI